MAWVSVSWISWPMKFWGTCPTWYCRLSLVKRHVCSGIQSSTGYIQLYIYIGYQFEFGSLPCLNDRREHIKLNIWNINMKHLFLVKCQRSDDSSIDAVVLGKV